jgi:hypothetical protein
MLQKQSMKPAAAVAAVAAKADPPPPPVSGLARLANYGSDSDNDDQVAGASPSSSSWTAEGPSVRLGLWDRPLTISLRPILKAYPYRGCLNKCVFLYVCFVLLPCLPTRGYHRAIQKWSEVLSFFAFKSYHPIPWRDSISRPIHSCSLCGGRRRRYQYDHAARACYDYCFGRFGLIWAGILIFWLPFGDIKVDFDCFWGKKLQFSWKAFWFIHFKKGKKNIF